VSQLGQRQVGAGECSPLLLVAKLQSQATGLHVQLPSLLGPRPKTGQDRSLAQSCLPGSAQMRGLERQHFRFKDLMLKSTLPFCLQWRVRQRWWVQGAGWIPRKLYSHRQKYKQHVCVGGGGGGPGVLCGDTALSFWRP
jgi:hypothetical protein